MALPDVSVDREHIHTRKVICDGYKRSDGLWDIEARLTDTKTYDFPNKDRGGHIFAGDAIHHMCLRLTLDLDFVIHAIDVISVDTPFHICKSASDSMQSLVGLQIKTGWMREVRARIGNKAGCTHLVELLGPLATTAYQTMHEALIARDLQQAEPQQPKIINTCVALAADGPVVAREWPEFYTGDSLNID